MLEYSSFPPFVQRFFCMLQLMGHNRYIHIAMSEKKHALVYYVRGVASR